MGQRISGDSTLARLHQLTCPLLPPATAVGSRGFPRDSSSEICCISGKFHWVKALKQSYG